MTGDEGISAIAERVLAIVVHYGDPVLTDRCLRSVAQGSVRPGRLVVVDNGPLPVDEEGVRRLGLPYDLVRPGRNVGFAAGVNLALDACPGFELAWLLNNDAQALPSAFAELLRTAEHLGRPALISSLIRDEGSGDIWFERARFYPWRLESKHVGAAETVPDDAIDPRRASILSIPYLPGCSLLAPTALGGSSGLLDPDYFVYGEDIDLALRATDRGWPLVVARRSVVLHRSSSGTSLVDRERLLAEAGIRVVRGRFPAAVPFALGAGIWLGAVRAILETNPRLVSARLEGYRLGLRETASASRR